MIYGTAERPYPAHRVRVRSAETPMDGDITEEYSGESYVRLPLPSQPLNALECRFTIKRNYLM